MGSPRGLYERDLLRVRVPDVLTMLVLAELSITPALAPRPDHRFEWLAPWVLATPAGGLRLSAGHRLAPPRGAVPGARQVRGQGGGPGGGFHRAGARDAS